MTTQQPPGLPRHETIALPRQAFPETAATELQNKRNKRDEGGHKPAVAPVFIIFV